jgi:hypothetical protein
VLKKMLGKLAGDQGSEPRIELQGSVKGLTPVFFDWDDSAGSVRVLAGPPAAPTCVIDLVSKTHRIVYGDGVLGDRLEIDGEPLRIPFGRGKEVKAKLAAAAIRTALGPPSWPEDRVALAVEFEQPDPVVMAWLRAWLEPDEVILALLATGDTVAIDSQWVQRKVDCGRWFLVTERRMVLLGVSPFGEAQVEELPAGPIACETVTGRTHRRVTGSGFEFKSTLLNQSRFDAIAPIGPLSPGSRLKRASSIRMSRSVASSGKVEADGPAARLLGLAMDRFSTASDAASSCYLAGFAEQTDDWTAKVAEAISTLDTSAMEEWVVAWDPPARVSTRLARAMAEHKAEADAICVLLQACLESARKVGAGSPETIGLEIEYCEQQLLAGESSRAVELASATLASLPPIEQADILSGSESDLERHFWLRTAKVRLLDVVANGDEGPGVQKSRLEACRSAPLDAARLRAAIESGKATNDDRLLRVHELLAPGGLGSRTEATTSRRDQPLSEAELELVRHDLARRKGLLSSLYGAIATVDPPDASTLRDYAERASSERYPMLFEALAEGASLLGAPIPAAYVARGQCRLAAVAHERPDRFVLVGGDHLDETSPHRLDRAELRFLIGTQLADLRFGHARATASQLREGALSKAASAASMLPFLSSIPVVGGVASRMGSVASFVQDVRTSPSAAIASRSGGGKKALIGGLLASATAMGAAHVMQRQASAETGRQEIRGELGVRTEDLLAEHRVFQLTSDRFGLLLSGCPRAAIRAMFLTRSDLLPELEEADRTGIASRLLRTDAEGRLVHPHLSVRVAALLGFYLSDDYRSLSGQLSP